MTVVAVALQRRQHAFVRSPAAPFLQLYFVKIVLVHADSLHASWCWKLLIILAWACSSRGRGRSGLSRGSRT